MSDRSDYQLRHTMFGRVGTLWQRQVQGANREAIRAIVGVSGELGVVGGTASLAAAAASPGALMVEGTSFRFEDGEHAIIGLAQRDYSHHIDSLPDGTPVYAAYRRQETIYSTVPLPTALARAARGFLAATEDVGSRFAEGVDWYLVPVPKGLYPIVIGGVDGSTYLVRGIDFEAYDGFIAMLESPSSSLPVGVVPVLSAQVDIPGAGVLPRSPFRPAGGGKYLARYMYRAQSEKAFVRAAAEFAGLHVFQDADSVMEVQTMVGGIRYIMAKAGTLIIDYPHEHLRQGDLVEEGRIVADHLRAVSYAGGDGAGLRRLVGEWDGDFSLDGLLPVKGLRWDGRDRVLADAVEEDPDTGTPHVRLHFDGESPALASLWDWQLAHERNAGDFLYDGLGLSSLPAEVDVWDLLAKFYGGRLMVVTAASHADDIDHRLRQFVESHKPASCCVLASLRTALPDGVLLDGWGVPTLDEDGKYAVA